MDVPALKSRVETYSQIVTLSAVAIYAAGFIVLSAQHASLGLPQLNLLRPRILSAGVLLFLFAGIPAWESLKLGEARTFASTDPTSPDKVRRGIELFPALMLAVAFSAMLARQLLVGGYTTPGTHDGRAVLGFLPFAAIVASVDVWLPPKYVRMIVLTIASVWLLLCIYWTRDESLYFLFAWFSWCVWTTMRTYGPITNVQRLKTVNLIQTVLGGIGTFGIFALAIYPRIPSVFGGGEPIPATISFVLQNNQPPIGNVPQLKVWMLDETDAGFFFLDSRDGKKAVYIPRNEVSAIHFGD